MPRPRRSPNWRAFAGIASETVSSLQSAVKSLNPQSTVQSRVNCYTRSLMPPVDIDAAVIGNARLSRDYSVLSLAAPEVGRRTKPGQFVMVKPVGVTDPLLRRPFSVFEVLRTANGEVTGVSILNKRAGRSTNKLYELEEGDVVSCLGPLGVPFTPVAAPMEAWMVAGGVGLAPFATLAETLAASRTPATLFYGARTSDELFYIDFFSALGITIVLTTEDGTGGVKGRVTVPLESALKTV